MDTYGSSLGEHFQKVFQYMKDNSSGYYMSLRSEANRIQQWLIENNIPFIMEVTYHQGRPDYCFKVKGSSH